VAVVALLTCLVAVVARPEPVAAEPVPVAPKIIGGGPADAATVPWAVALLTTSGSQFCGGTLVAAEWVVTAAHCVSDRSAGSTRVAWGFSTLSSVTAANRRAVSTIIVHPNYNTSLLTSDIALLRLTTPAPDAVTLAINRDAGVPAAHQALHTYGWGQTASTPRPDHLQGVALQEMAGTGGECGLYGPYYRAAHHVCAGVPGGGKDACYGDSGGPLVAQARCSSA
jgi:secreted trypsin-like serine protease